MNTGGTVILTLEELNDLLASLTASNSKVYVITNNAEIYVDDQDDEGFVYDTIRNDYSDSYSTSPSSIWMNSAPCPTCTNRLYQTFKDTIPKPTIYVETFDYNESNYEELRQSIGCLAKLQYHNFTVQAWNWTTFETLLTDTVECRIAIDIQTAATNYSYKKAHFTKYMDLFPALQDNHTIHEWCV